MSAFRDPPKKLKQPKIVGSESGEMKASGSRQVTPPQTRPPSSERRVLSGLNVNTAKEGVKGAKVIFKTRRKSDVSVPPTAPENTTQYLMNIVYDDMKLDTNAVASDSFSSKPYGDLSPRSVYALLDHGYEGSLAFQNIEFEEMWNRARSE